MNINKDMFYQITVFCSNCLLSDEIEIEKGKTVIESDCPNCGCKTLNTGKRNIHKIQEDLLTLINQVNLDGKTLREIGKFVKIDKPQQIVHHLGQLELDGFIIWDKKNKIIKPTKLGMIKW